MALMMENGIETDEDMCATVMARFRNSQQPEHKHLCAVVAAMAEVLREQSLTPSPTAYFAAAMSSLDRQTKSPSRNEAVTTALCTFLALALPKTPVSVRRSKSDAILKLLVKLLTTEEANAATVKAGLSCVENVLVAADKSNWLALAPSFNLLLHHCLDARPKVRKRAQGCIVEVLTNLHGTHALTTASDSVVSLFERSLATVSKSLSGGKSEMAQSSNTTGAVEVLHMLGALKQLLPHLSAKAIGRILPHLGMLHELQQPLLTRTVLDTLQALCMSPSADIPAASLGEILGRLGSLLSSGERRNSVDEVTVISHVIQHGFDRLHGADHHLCVTKLPTVFHSLAGLLASEQEGIVYSAGDCMRSLVASCIDEPMIKQGVSQLQSQGTQRKGALTAIERICVTCESTLSYQYSTAWDMALHIITALFDKLGRDSAVLMVGTVKTLGDLQNLSDNDMPYRKQVPY
jgi:ribosomal RNA-processing protein 12